MSSASNIFLEDTSVGGVPCFAHLIRKFLPKNKKKRQQAYRIQMYVLTYATYAIFNMARRPTAVVKGKILEECNDAANGTAAMSRLQQLETRWARKYHTSAPQWCSEILFAAVSSDNTQEFLGFLDSVFLFVYGLCLFLSGVIADCYNPRFYLTMGCILSGFFCALLGLFDYWNIRSFKFYATVLILKGASQSTSWPVVLSSVTHWYEGKRRGLFFGFWNTHNYSGSMLGTYLAGLFVDGFWGMAFFLPGLILAVTGAIVLSCMVVDPDDLKELDKEPGPLGSKRRFTELEIPQWLGQSRSIKLYDAIKLPGVIEFSASMFFSRMVGYSFLYWLPFYIKNMEHVSAKSAAFYSIAYFVGGSIGGIVAGVFVDLFRRSALVCAVFLLAAISVLAMGLLEELGTNLHIDFPMWMLIGLFVEAPYVVISTSVSADLGTHKMIKRNHRAISTIGGIIEGTGAVGAAIGNYLAGVVFVRFGWSNVLFMMMALQFLAALCISKYAYKDFMEKKKRKPIRDYWRTSSVF